MILFGCFIVHNILCNNPNNNNNNNNNAINNMVAMVTT